MPSIEFIGFELAEAEQLENELRVDLGDLTFSDEIIFVNFLADVRGFNGERQAYLRVCTRNKKKADILMVRLKHYADVEYIRSDSILFKDDPGFGVAT